LHKYLYILRTKEGFENDGGWYGGKGGREITTNLIPTHSDIVISSDLLTCHGNGRGEL